MSRRIKNHMLILLAGIMVLLTPLTASAESSSNYSFGETSGVNKIAPIAYEVEKVYHATDLEGVDNLDDLASMFVTEDSIYVATRNAILIFDYNFKLKHTLSEYTDLSGNAATISSPNGIFVSDAGTLYVCEPSGGHILVFDSGYQLLHSFGMPKGINLNINYQPNQIVVDSLNRMYVIAGNIYEGILEIDSENNFQRYFGTTTVSISPLQVFYRAIASEEQLNRQTLMLPTEYSSMTVNGKGFIYTTIRSEDEKTPIRLLNVKGDDIMPEDWHDDPPKGDMNFAGSGDYAGPSNLTYIDCNDYGMYMVLDAKQNRIFTYDSASNMLFVFGGRGDKDGCFLYPVSVRWMGESDKVIVADRQSRSITVMKPTNYAEAIFQAVKLEAEGDREDSLVYWQEALDMNSNCVVAKDAIGRQLYWAGDYEGSQKLLGDILRTDYYSMAFEKTREQLIRKYATPVVIAAAVLIIALTVFRRVRRSKKGGNGYAG